MLPVIDRIIDETLALERDRGMLFFLIDYARAGRFEVEPPRSLFLDGEIALMMGLRRMVSEKPAYRRLFRERVDLMVERMDAAPVMCLESYPNECWLFCNTVALAAIKVGDILDGTDQAVLQHSVAP